MDGPAIGHRSGMSHQRKRHDPQIKSATSEEDVDRADTVDRLGLDPEEQENYPDDPQHEDADSARESSI